MGVQESENYCVLTRRMKRQRMSFSINGSENLAKVLCYYHSESYSGASSLTDINILPDKLINHAEEHIREIEKKIKKIKKDRINIYLGNQVYIAEGYSNIRNILKDKPISELRII